MVVGSPEGEVELKEFIYWRLSEGQVILKAFIYIRMKCRKTIFDNCHDKAGGIMREGGIGTL